MELRNESVSSSRGSGVVSSKSEDVERTVIKKPKDPRSILNESFVIASLNVV